MKILITGCRGQLGTELQKQLAAGESELGRLPEAVQQAGVVAVDMDVLDISDLADWERYSPSPKTGPEDPPR